MPDPEDSVDELSDEDVADGPDRGGETGHHHPDAVTDYSDEGHYQDDEDFPPGEGFPAGEDDFSAGEDHYAAQGAFAGSSADDYPEFPPRQAGPSSSEPPTSPPSLFRRGHRGLGDWRGGHRSEGGRRGVSIGVIVALVAVVVVVGTVILWSFFGDALSNRSHKAAGRCVGGKETVAVIADPSIADSVQQFAESYNSSAGPVGDHCMVVSVKPAGSDAVLNGFIGKWPAELGGQPALWIPGSSISAARLAGATAQKTITDSRSLGDVAGGARRAAGTRAGPGQPELGGTARTANQPERIGRVELAGVGIAATGAADERQR